MNRATLLLALAAAILPAAAPAQRPATAAANPAAIAESNRVFALDLYRQVAREERGNVFLSPVSVTFALAPLIAGAGGATRDEIGRALRLPTGGAVHPALGDLQRALEREGRNATISISNALWLNREFAPREAFLDNARTHYGSSVERLDFGGNPEGAATRINRWADEETRGRIPHVIDADDLNAQTRLIVSNAVYFLADWREPFPPGSEPDRFRLAAGGAIEVPMMAQVGDFRHYRGTGFAALDLPYVDERLVMTLLLPDDPNGIAALERALTPALLERTLRALDRAGAVNVSVKLPRLQLQAMYALTAPLARLGMRRAFAPGAEFGGLADQPLWINGVQQFTFLRVDEQGTEAAAVTLSDVIVTGARRVRPPIPFHADHPFLMLLRDRESGAILFIGRIMRPQ